MPAGQNLCLQCGLCCNGVIFADGQLQPTDDADRLRLLGLRLKRVRSGSPKFHQPCAAFDGCACRIYAERPDYCRQFECALLKNVIAGEVTVEQARRVIAKARRRAARVLKLLRKLGDQDENLAPGVRFRRLSKRIHQSGLDRESAALFGQLTVSVHELNVVLSSKFYLGD